MADAFDRLKSGLRAREGGYVSHPDDLGGETNHGITAAVAREEGYRGPMRAMTWAQAEGIYRSRFWSRPGFDKVARLSEVVAEELFDTGVNMGPEVATRWLQRALNVLNRKGADYPDLNVDGRLGPKTLDALARLLQVRGRAAERILLSALNGLQAAKYIELAEGREANESFAFGWLAARIGVEA